MQELTEQQVKDIEATIETLKKVLELGAPKPKP